VAEFDEGVFGAEAAAQHHFGVPAPTSRRRRPRGLPPSCPRRKRGRQASPRLRARPRGGDPRRRRHDPRRRSRRVLCELNFHADFGIKAATRIGHRSARDFMTRLYHFALSPFCRKVRLVLAEKKIDVELVDEKYWEPSPNSCAATRPARCRSSRSTA
jgi:hypothetical protein